MYVHSSERTIEQERVAMSNISNATLSGGYFTDYNGPGIEGSGSGSGSGASVTYKTRQLCFGSTGISSTHTYYICLVSYRVFGKPA